MRRIGLSGGYSVVCAENWLNSAGNLSARPRGPRNPDLARFANGSCLVPNWSYCRYAESTTSITGRPALRLGSNWSKNNRHQRIHPVGTQM